MIEELNKYFINRISSILLEYVKTFNQSNVRRISLGFQSNIVFENLELRKDVLLKLGIPMTVSGRVGRISIKIPISYKSHQSLLLIENTEIFVKPITEDYIEKIENPEQKNTEDYKKQKLKLWEEKMRNYFETLKSPSWINNIIENILANMQITFKNVIFHYETNLVLGYDTILTLRVEDFQRISTDSNYNPVFIKNSNERFNLYTVSKLSVSLSKKNKKEENDEINDINSQQDLANDNMEENVENLENLENLEKENNQKRQNDSEMILLPLDFEIRSRKSKGFDFGKEEKVDTAADGTYEILLDKPIILMMNNKQKDYFLGISEQLTCLDKVQKHLHLRPVSQLKKENKNGKEWFRYAVRAIKEKNEKRLTLKKFFKQILLMKNYISLYKRKQKIIDVPWLNSDSLADDDPKLRICEETIPVEQLIKYREWAFIEIMIEAKRYFNSQKNGRDKFGMKPLQEVWTNVLNNEEAFFNTNNVNKKELNILLTDVEKINLYVVLSWDKQNVLKSFLRGEKAMRHEISLEFNIMGIIKILIVIVSEFYFLFLENIEKKTQKIDIFRNCDCNFCAKNIKSKRKETTSVKEKESELETDRKSEREKSNTNLSSINLENRGFETPHDSFYEHFEDLKNEKNFPKFLANVNTCQTFEKQKDFKNKKRKIIVIFSLVGITMQLWIYRDSKILINPEKQFQIENIYFFSPNSLQYLFNKYTQQKNLNISKEEKKDDVKDKEKILTGTKKKMLDLYNKLYELVRKADTEYSNGDNDFQIFLEFLKEKELNPLKQFVELYEKEKVTLFILQPKISQSKFKKFFNPEDPDYLHFPKHIIDLYENSEKDPQKVQSHKVLNYANSHLDYFIKSTIFGVFLEECALSFLSSALKFISRAKKEPFISTKKEYTFTKTSNITATLTDLKTIFQRKNTNQNIVNTKIDVQTNILNMHFFFKGSERTDFKIVSKEPIKKEKITKKNEKESMEKGVFSKINSLENENSNLFFIEKDNSFVNLELGNVLCYLTTNAVTSLAYFFKANSNKYLKTNYFLNKQFYKLLECILMFGKVKELTDLKKQEILMLDLKITIEKFKINIINNSETYRSPHGISFLLNNLTLKTLKQRTDLKKCSEMDERIIKIFEKKAYYYDIKKFFIKNFEIKNIKQFHCVDKEKPFLKSELYSIITKAYLQNNPLLVDQKILINFPKININIADNLYCLFELSQIISKIGKIFEKKSEPVKKKHKKLEELKYTFKKHSVLIDKNVEFILQNSILLNELEFLLHEHNLTNLEKSKKNCKHCLIKFKKSNFILNLVVGNYGKYFNRYNNTDFEFLDYLMKCERDESNIYLQDEDSGIKIKIFSSLEKSIKYKIILPFLLFTKDQGFFKNNITIHCSKSSLKKKKNFPYSASLKKEDRDFTKNFDKYPTRNKSHTINYSEKNPFVEKIINLEKIKNKKKNYKKFGTFFFFEPSWYCSKDLLLFMEDDHYLYCRRLEKQLVENIQEKENKIYLLMYRKEVKLRELLNLFDWSSKEQHKKNMLFCKINKLELNFDNVESSILISSVINNISFFIEKFNKYSEEHPLFEKSRDANKEKKILAIRLRNRVKKEIIDFNINKIKIFSNLSDTLTKFIKLRFSNINMCVNLELLKKNENDKISISKSLFHLNEIYFEFSGNDSSRNSKFTLSNISFNNNLETFIFSVQQIICYSRNEEKLFEIIPYPCKCKPILCKCKKAFTLTLTLIPEVNKQKLFEIRKDDNKQDEIKIEVAPMQLSISKENIQEILNNCKILIEKHKLFCLNYKKFIKSTILDTKYKKKKLVILKKNLTNTMSPNIEIKIDSIFITFTEADTLFSQNQFKNLLIINNRSFIDITIQEIFLNCYPTSSEIVYKQLISSIVPSQKIFLKMIKKKKDNVWNLHLAEAQLFVVNRFLKEIEIFLNEILKFNNEEVNEPEFRNFEKILAKNSKFYGSLVNCGLVIPRNSKSNDKVIVNFKKGSIEKFLKVNQIIEIPKDVEKNNWEIVKKDHVLIHKEDENLKNIDFDIGLNIEDLDITFQIGSFKKEKLLDTKELDISVLLPFSPGFKENMFSLKNNTSIEFTDLDLDTNLANLERISDLFSQNFNEESDLFPYVKSFLQNIILNIDNEDLDVSTKMIEIPEETFKKIKNIENDIIKIDRKDSPEIDLMRNSIFKDFNRFEANEIEEKEINFNKKKKKNIKIDTNDKNNKNDRDYNENSKKTVQSAYVSRESMLVLEKQNTNNL